MGKWLSGSSTQCVKSCVLNTQSPFKARHAAPVYCLSFSVMRAESQRQENLWRPLPAWHEQRQGHSSRIPISYMVEDKDLHMCTVTHACLYTPEVCSIQRWGREERGREMYRTHIKGAQSSICFKNLFQEFERLLYT